MLLKSIRLVTIVMVALCLVPAGAHFFELTNKMSLSPAEYMTVQRIYAGWAFFGIPIIAALLLTLLHTFMVRNDRPVFKLSLTAALCLAATQLIFWRFTYPINAGTNFWTVRPEAFEAARRQWGSTPITNTIGIVVVAALAASAAATPP